MADWPVEVRLWRFVPFGHPFFKLLRLQLIITGLLFTNKRSISLPVTMGVPVKAPSHDDHRIFLRYQLFPYKLQNPFFALIKTYRRTQFTIP